MGLGSALGLAVAGWGWWRWKQARSRVYDPLIIKEKVGRIAFDGELELIAVLPETAEPKEGLRRAREVLEPVAAAYRHYDHPAGARFKANKVRPIVPVMNLHPAGPGLFGKRSVLGVREAAALWHPPGARDETPLLERSGSKGAFALGQGGAGRRPGGRHHGRAAPGRSTSPRTCCAATTSTWPAPAWASPP